MDVVLVVQEMTGLGSQALCIVHHRHVGYVVIDVVEPVTLISESGTSATPPLHRVFAFPKRHDNIIALLHHALDLALLLPLDIKANLKSIDVFSMATRAQHPTCWLLERLPPEVRNLIWCSLFRSTAGSVILGLGYKQHYKHMVMDEYCCWNDDGGNLQQPRDTVKTGDWHIGFSMYRTCKQIYTETRGLVGKLNTLVLDPGEWTLDLGEFDLKQLIHVDLNIDLRRGYEIEAAAEALQKLGKLATTGRLRILTLSPAGGLLSVIGLGELRHAGANKDLEDRKILIVTGWRFLSAENQWRVVRSLATSGFQHVLDAFKDMHDAFGGEIWQDGALCFKDGMGISQLFRLSPVVGEEFDRREEEKIGRRNRRREKRRLGESYSDSDFWTGTVIATHSRIQMKVHMSRWAERFRKSSTQAQNRITKRFTMSTKMESLMQT
ncbi:hypothetical protein BDZ45DRAFT_773212 [Acephala macrosclerotiorum]|nr:hypothetical protein BDZ45DRAFT_773212 [Acephala macrosclerotiorum]